MNRLKQSLWPNFLCILHTRHDNIEAAYSWQSVVRSAKAHCFFSLCAFVVVALYIVFIILFYFGFIFVSLFLSTYLYNCCHMQWTNRVRLKNAMSRAVSLKIFLSANVRSLFLRNRKNELAYDINCMACDVHNGVLIILCALNDINDVFKVLHATQTSGKHDFRRS